MDAVLREYSAAIKGFLLEGASWGGRCAAHRAEMVYAVLALSLLLLAVRLAKGRRQGQPSAGVWRTAHWLLVVLISLLELVHVLSLGRGTTWFCSPRAVGWLWTGANFVATVLVLFNQALSYFHALVDLRCSADAEFDWEWGAYAWPVAVVVGALTGMVYEPALVVVLGLFVALQAVLLGRVFRSIVPRGGWAKALVWAGVYLVGAAAMAAVLLHFLKLLVLVLIGGFVLSVLATDNKSSGQRQGKPQSDAQRCPICGSTMGCVCEARRRQEQQERRENSRW